MLREENSDQYMGYLLMQVSLAPLTRDEQEQVRSGGPQLPLTDL